MPTLARFPTHHASTAYHHYQSNQQFQVPACSTIRAFTYRPIISPSFAMEDLLDNFASQSLDSPSEEGYKYHFVNGSPTGSQHARPAATASPASVGPSPQATGGEKEYEGDVDNDDDDDDDDENERYDADLEGTNGASYPQNARFEDIDYHSFEPHGASSGANYGNAEISLSPSDDGWDGFALHLRRLHRQDMERDELLTVGVPSSPLVESVLTLPNSNSITKIRT